MAREVGLCARNVVGEGARHAPRVHAPLASPRRCPPAHIALVGEVDLMGGGGVALVGAVADWGGSVFGAAGAAHKGFALRGDCRLAPALPLSRSVMLRAAAGRLGTVRKLTAPLTPALR